MRIVKAEESTCMLIETAEDNNYIRYSSNCWSLVFGPSETMVYDCRELERTYQLYMKNSE